MAVAASNVHATLGRWILAHGMPIVWDIDKSKGSYLHDAKSGIDYLDFFGFFATRTLAFNHPRLVEPAFTERLLRAARQRPSNCDLYSEPYASFVDKLGRVTLGDKLSHLFFIDGGGPAVDNAVKTAIDWKHRKNLANGRGERGSQMLHFRQAFHGRTGYALSLTDSHDSRKTQFFPKFAWPRVMNPTMRFPFDAAAERDVIEREAQSLAEIAAVFDAADHDIAGIIVEPIQGEGGDNYFRREFLQALRRVCDEREALLVFDEVQTGFGSSGSWWDWQNHGVVPDVMVFGKKTQVCGIAAGPRLDEVDSVFKVASRISSTWEGNLVDMVRADQMIDVIVEDDLLTHTRRMGEYLVKVLHDLSLTHPEMTAVRGRGALAAFDLPSAAERDRLVGACFEEQLLVVPGGTRSVRLRPSLDVHPDAIGRCAAQLESAIRRAYGKKR